MSKSDFAPHLAAALDRFDVPPMTAGLADRIAASAASPAVRGAPRRDRRGVWKRGRQVLLGGLAVGMLSAAAVASGLLGAAGIRVPVLTAMLAPEPKPAPVVRAKPKPVQRQAAAKPAPAPVVEAVVAAPLAPSLAERRLERRERAQAFAAEHPVLARAILRKVAQRRAYLAANPAARRAYLATHPAVAQAVREQVEAHRAGTLPPNPADRRELLIERVQEIRAERAEALTLPAPQVEAGEADPSGLVRPAERAQRLQTLREMRMRRAAIRELRRQRQR